MSVARLLAPPALACLAGVFIAAMFVAFLVSDDAFLPPPPSSSTSSSGSTTITTTTTATTVAPCAAVPLTWSYELVSSENTTVGGASGKAPSATVDASGEPFAFFAAGTGALWAVRRTGASWSDELVDSRTAVDTSLRSASAALVDAQPAAAYRLTSTGFLHFVQWNGTVWVITDLALEVGGSSASMAVAPDGHPRIAHYNSAVLRLVTRAAGPTWSGQTVKTSSAFFASCALAFLGANPAIAYQDVTGFAPANSTYGAQVWNGTAWIDYPIENAATFTVFYVAAAVLSGNLIVAWEKPSGAIGYAELNGTSWAAEVVPEATSSVAGMWPSLTVAFDRPVLAYCNSTASGDVCAVTIKSCGFWATESTWTAAQTPEGTTATIVGGYPAVAFKVGTDANSALAYVEASAA